MKGIEILSQAKVVVESSFNWKAFWIAFAVVGVIGFIISFAALHDIDWGVVAMCSGAIMILGGGLVGAMMGAVLEKPVVYETHYKVLISEEVKMNDFLEKYEIVDQEGKIFTVREIEKE